MTRVTRHRTLTIGMTLAAAVAVAVPAAVAQGSSKPAVVREGDHWFLHEHLSGGPATESFHYGRPGDEGLLCDWNGDGVTTPGVVRRSAGPTWFIRYSRSGGVAHESFIYGRLSDRPVCGDWNGDGTQTPGVVRTDGEMRFHWHLRDSLGGGTADTSFVYGRNVTSFSGLWAVYPVVGDWNGDGRETPGIVRLHEDGRMRWLLRDSNSGGPADHDVWFYEDAVSPFAHHGEGGERVLVGDWTGDGIDAPGVFRERGGTPQWWLRHERSSGPADEVFSYGRPGDIPLTWK